MEPTSTITMDRRMTKIMNQLHKAAPGLDPGSSRKAKARARSCSRLSGIHTSHRQFHRFWILLWVFMDMLCILDSRRSDSMRSGRPESLEETSLASASDWNVGVGRVESSLPRVSALSSFRRCSCSCCRSSDSPSRR